MTPDWFLPAFAIFALCASCGVFLLFFSITAFLGYAVIDIWNDQNYLKPANLLYLFCLTLIPEIGVMAWVVHFGRNRSLNQRIIAFAVSVAYFLMHIAFFFMLKGGGLDSFTALVSGTSIRCMLSPFFIIGGVISVFIFREILIKKNKQDQK